MPSLPPPQSIDELYQRAERIAGYQVAELAAELSIVVPENLQRAKGFTGQLLEKALGAHAGSKATQDFADLGVELKSIPINRFGKPLETTYVCYAPLLGTQGLTWEQSSVYHKLSKVLFIPILAEPEIPVAMRLFGMPILWSPNDNQLQQLRQDWEELMELIHTGQVQNITARHGEVLHIRPKAADGSALTEAIGPDGTTILTRPRGFYLRTKLTAAIIAQRK